MVSTGENYEKYLQALRLLDAKQIKEAGCILRPLVSQFPEKLKYSEAMLEVYFRLGNVEEMLELFSRLLERFHPTEDAVYDTIYVRGLIATNNPPTPLLRMLRFYELIRQFQRTQALPGEVVECGCFRGFSSYLICSYLKRYVPTFSGQGYSIFDSFQGLSTPCAEDDVPPNFENAKTLINMTQVGAFAATLNQVKRNLSEFPDIEFHPGWIPVSFHGLPEKKYRFVHVDVDLYDPTWGCLDYFYPRLVSGGVLVSDDYSWPGARKAIDEFCAERRIGLDITHYQQAVLLKV